jgi:hypothetical protein
MSDSYAAGSVWWFRHDFGGDRGEIKKYCVFLSDCSVSGGALLAITTSRARRYHGQTASPCGYPDNPCYRIEPGEEACFPETTFVQFDNLRTFTRKELDGYEARGKAGYLQPLSEQRFRSILNCAKKSDDIPGSALQIIERTIKSLKPSRQTPPKGQPVAAPPFVPTEILSMRVRVDARCTTCRATLAGLMEMTEAEISICLTGTVQLADRFLENLGAGFDLLGTDCPCTKK